MTLGERVVTVISGIVLGVALSAVALLALGWRPVVLLSDSMAPTAAAGDLLVARPIDAAQVRVRDVLTLPGTGQERLTHRVVAVERVGTSVVVRLKGDANDSPDPGSFELGEGLLRTVLVVPVVGRLVTGDAVLLWGGLVAMGIGAAVLRGRGSLGARAPREPAPAQVRSERPVPIPVSAPTAAPVDPRITALAATLEALVEEGLPSVTARQVARVRTGSVLRLSHVETATESLALDDGARFVLIAHVDLDVPALSSVPLGAARSRAAHDAVDAWWRTVEHEVPQPVREELEPFLTS